MVQTTIDMLPISFLCYNESDPANQASLWWCQQTLQAGCYCCCSQLVPIVSRRQPHIANHQSLLSVLRPVAGQRHFLCEISLHFIEFFNDLQHFCLLWLPGLLL